MPGPLAHEVASRIASAAGLDPDEVVSYLTQPPDAEMGDYSLPCFRLAKKLKKDPKRIAAELAEKTGTDGVLAEVVAAGPYRLSSIRTANIPATTTASASSVCRNPKEADPPSEPTC